MGKALSVSDGADGSPVPRHNVSPSAKKRFLVHEFVLMSDHFHVLLTPTGISLERAVQFIKGGFSYRVGKELVSNVEVWGRGYVDHRIRDENDYWQHVEYIRQNPVEARIVLNAAEYSYSSAHEGFEVDPCPQGLKPRILTGR
jgi:putative transposase